MKTPRKIRIGRYEPATCTGANRRTRRACRTHRQGRKQGARGSNAHLGDVDLMVQIAVDESGVRTATITKNNDGAEGVLTRFKLEIVTLGKDEDDDDITAAIVASDLLDSEKEKSRAKLNKSQRRAMELLDRCVIEEGKPAPTTEYPRGVSVVPMARWQTACLKGGLSPAGTKESAVKAFRRADERSGCHAPHQHLGRTGLDRLRMSHAPRPTGQTGTKSDKVGLCPRSNPGQTRTHPYRGVRCPEDPVVKKVGSREEVRRARRGRRRCSTCWCAPASCARYL